MSVAVAETFINHAIAANAEIPNARNDGELFGHLIGLSLSISATECHVNNIWRLRSNVDHLTRLQIEDHIAKLKATASFLEASL